MTKIRQLIAMGGGGFTMEPENLALDGYVLEATGAETPAVGFLASASGDSHAYIELFHAAFSTLPCRPSHLSLFSRTPDLRAYLMSQDVIYVGGGNTKSLLGLWREWGLPALLREAWEAGVVLAGVSAGAVCWFDQCLSDAYEEDLRIVPCLGFLPGTCCPHYNGDPERRPTLHRRLRNGELPRRDRHRRRRGGPLPRRPDPSRRRLAPGSHGLPRGEAGRRGPRGGASC